MAYIDDNNDLAAGKGKDPLTELDEELEKLMAELGETKSETDPAPPVSAPPVREAHFDVEPSTPALNVRKNAPEPPKPPKKRGKILIIVIVSLLAAGLVGFGAWKLYGLVTTPLSEYLNKGNEDSTTPTVYFSDPELGTVAVKEVDDEKQNEYDPANLTKTENGYYQYVVDGKVVSEVGVDIAEYQGDVDFAALKNSGVDYVILRIGGRYYSEEGSLYEDGRFDDYYAAAKSAGLKVGTYFFSQARTPEEAAQEADFVLSKLGGRTLEYPVAFDWEIIEDDEARTDNTDGATLTAMAKAFCDAIENGGCDAIVYASTSLMLQSYDFDTMQDYNFWLADYREFPNMYYDFAMWQYSKEGTADGIDGTVDLNICFKPY